MKRRWGVATKELNMALADSEVEARATSFAELGVSQSVCDTLAKRDIHVPFEIQALVMSDALAGNDVLAKSRTGSGKTLAFAVPIVEKIDAAAARPAALVLVPTRELAVQVTEECTDVAKARGLKVASVYGGVSIKEQADRSKKAHVIIATPGRLQDLVERRLLNLSDVRVLVLDEADRMLDMGFQPQVDRIVDLLPEDRQTMFFSATLDGHVGFVARAYTRDAVLHETEAPRETVDEAEHRFIEVDAKTKFTALADLLSEEKGLALVFMRTKRGADRLAYRLKGKGVNAAAMHGDLTQGARQKALNDFEAGKIRVLIATDVAARGLDLDDITLVVNYDPPEDDKAYVHRVGRTARAGRSGTSVTLVLPDQQHDVGRMADRLALKEEFEESGMDVAPPRLVYTSHRGAKSNLRPPPRRRF
ncbi:MAG TPA: DEAD/DEAH box helicase [Actinomycetota bacterium]|nr:DEAD/DEAH box helicase [Actinomycetota bacterium]